MLPLFLNGFLNDFMDYSRWDLLCHELELMSWTLTLFSSSGAAIRFWLSPMKSYN
jgi:hypothetical protein